MAYDATPFAASCHQVNHRLKPAVIGALRDKLEWHGSAPRIGPSSQGLLAARLLYRLIQETFHRQPGASQSIRALVRYAE